MPERRASGNPVPAAEVRSMFDRIAPIYDRMNTVMTAGLDARWRRTAARVAGLRPGNSAVDVACGSGALTRELAHIVGASGTVTGVDISTGMLQRALAVDPGPGAALPRYVIADALDLPLDDGSVDAATIGFGLRNLSDHKGGLAEMTRVTRPGGRVVILEIATPSSRVGRGVAAIWFRRVVPLLGRMAGGRAAYRYLPASVERYPTPGQVGRLMREVGLVDVRWRRMALGLVTLHVGRRP